VLSCQDTVRPVAPRKAYCHLLSRPEHENLALENTMKTRVVLLIVAAAFVTVMGITGVYFALRNTNGIDPATGPLVANPLTEEPSPAVYRPASVSLAKATEFLYTGANPKQVGVKVGTPVREVPGREAPQFFPRVDFP